MEIWTRRQNYELIFGRRVHPPWRWLLVLAHLSLWMRLPGRPRLRLAPSDPSPKDRP